MTSKENYIISIEGSAAIISAQLGHAVVDHVFRRYGARGVEDLNPSYLSEVFSELYAIEADLR